MIEALAQRRPRSLATATRVTKRTKSSITRWRDSSRDWAGARSTTLRGRADHRRTVVSALGRAPRPNESQRWPSSFCGTSPTEEGGGLLAARGISVATAQLPVVILQFRPDLPALQNPPDDELGDAFGVNVTLRTRTRRFDVTIIGAGPAGHTAAAVYGASRGSITLVIDEGDAIGGQAGTTSLYSQLPRVPCRGQSTRWSRPRCTRQPWGLGASFSVSIRQRVQSRAKQLARP